jgi:alcohol dehydrogenase, propanol-preferring
MVHPADGALELSDLPEPSPGEDEVVIDVKVCGVCRTDLQVVAGDLQAVKDRVVPGHQVVGRVVGSGQRVGVAWLHWACGECEFCRTGFENLCEQATFTGWSVDGGYADRLLAKRAFIYPIPDRFTDTDAAPLLCAGIIGFRALRLCGIRPGQRLGLFGFGSSAHLAIQVAIDWGCDVFVFAHTVDEARLARELGAVWAGGYEDAAPADLHAAVTFAPVGTVVIRALENLRPGGTVAVNAIHLDHVPEFDYDLLWRERAIRSVANFTRADATEFLQIAADIPIKPEVTLYPLDRAAVALADLQAGRVRGSIVLDCS